MRAVSIIRRWLSPALGFVHRTRLAALWIAVEGLVACGTASLTAIGRASRRSAAPKHRIKAIDRLMGNPRLHCEVLAIYRAIARLLAGKAAKLVVLVDWTQIGAKAWALTAAVPIGGRALPICTEVHAASWLGNRGVQRRFVKRLRQMLPADCQAVLVSDAGFGAPWFKDVRALGWDFVGRIRGHKRVRAVGTEPWLANAVLRNRANSRPASLGVFDVGRWDPARARLVSVRKRPQGRKSLGRRGRPRTNGLNRKHARSAREPWLLATSLIELSASQVVGLYRRRMQIEELFRDEKNHRFGWSLGLTMSTDARRLQVLLLLLALGVIAMTLLGLSLEQRRLHHCYQANTVRCRRILSFFVLGTLAAASNEHRATQRQLACALTAARTAAQC